MINAKKKSTTKKVKEKSKEKGTNVVVNMSDKDRAEVRAWQRAETLKQERQKKTREERVWQDQVELDKRVDAKVKAFYNSFDKKSNEEKRALQEIEEKKLLRAIKKLEQEIEWDIADCEDIECDQEELTKLKKELGKLRDGDMQLLRERVLNNNIKNIMGGDKDIQMLQKRIFNYYIKK